MDFTAPALVFAPHPDDEVLGCGGTIALKAAAGARINVVVMTDGRTSHSAWIDPGALIRMRRDEALLASTRLGLRAEHCVFLDFEDQCLATCGNEARRQVLALLERFSPQQVFVPHRRDQLADHVATFDVVSDAVKAFGRRIIRFEYPVWLWNIWPWTSEAPGTQNALSSAARIVAGAAAIALGCRTRIDVRSALQVKREALAAYASQMSRLNGDPRWPILADVADGTFLERFLGGLELFRQTQLGR